MSFPTTANGWTAYVRDFIGADEYSDAQVSMFLDLAVNRMNREMSGYKMEYQISLLMGSLQVGLEKIDLTTMIDNFSKIRLVSVLDTTTGPLDVLSFNEMKKMQAEDRYPGGTPTHYAIDAGVMYIYPFPAIDSTVEVFYYRQLNLLQFGQYYPDALLHAACLEAAPYMVEDERIQIWEPKYLAALIAANEEGDKIKLGSTPLKREFKVMDRRYR
jgi:hypothetical protein